MIRKYGVPGILYSDAHTIFFSPKSGKLSAKEELKGYTVALTQFGKALDILKHPAAEGLFSTGERAGGTPLGYPAAPARRRHATGGHHHHRGGQCFSCHIS